MVLGRGLGGVVVVGRRESGIVIEGSMDRILYVLVSARLLIQL